MALVESSYYEDDPSLSRQVGQYTPPPPVRLQRGGMTRLGIALAGALIAGATFIFALFATPASFQGAGTEIKLVATEPAGSEAWMPESVQDPEFEERRAARQVALLANLAPPPEPQPSVVDLTKTSSALGKPMTVARADEKSEGAATEAAVSVKEPVVSAEPAKKADPGPATDPAPEFVLAEAEMQPEVLPEIQPKAQSEVRPEVQAEADVPLPRSKPQTGATAPSLAAASSPTGDDAQQEKLAKSEASFQAATEAEPEPVRKAPVKLQKSSFSASVLALNPAPNAMLTETSENGLLPVVGPGGETSREHYKRPFPAGETRPRISLVVGGLGLSQKATRAAIEKLPPEVTLAFAPYGKDLQTWIDLAREDGHEVLLELPMEPFDYPSNDPGPFTLLTNNSAGQNNERLNWLLAQFNGYIGVTNYLGAKFTATPEALMPVLRSLDQRGLMVLDDGTSNRSMVQALSARLGVPHARAAKTVDLRASRNAIDDNLLDLERAAMRKGGAIGMGFAYPVTIDRIVRWAATLEDKGLVLAPVSANLATEKSGDPFDTTSF